VVWLFVVVFVVWGVDPIVVAAWRTTSGCRVAPRGGSGIPANARSGIVGVSAGPLGDTARTVQRLPAEPIMCRTDYLADADENTHDELTVNFIGADHVSMLYTFVDEGESAQSRSWSNVSGLFSLDSLHARGWLTTDEARDDPPLGATLDSLIIAQLNDSLRAMTARDSMSGGADEASSAATHVISLAHRRGRWFFEASAVEQCSACDNTYWTSVVSQPPPPSVVGMDSLSVPWAEVVRVRPSAVDAFTTASAGVVVVRDSTSLEVFRARDGRIAESMGVFPLTKEVRVVGAKWFQGAELARWRDTLVSQLAHTTLRMRFRPRADY
jgi:hypothetical protein